METTWLGGGKFPVVVMQRLCEPVHDIDMVSLNGKVIQTLPRRRVHSAAPNEGHVVTPDQKLIELAEIVIRNFKLSWLQDIDAMYDDNGTPYILEINPRPSGSFAVSIAAGVPLIDEIVSIAKKQKNGEKGINYYLSPLFLEMMLIDLYKKRMEHGHIFPVIWLTMQIKFQENLMC